MKTEFTLIPHPSDETLEEYLFGRLPPGREELFEEHVLQCVACQNALVATEDNICLMKSVLRALPVGQAERKKSKASDAEKLLQSLTKAAYG